MGQGIAEGVYRRRRRLQVWIQMVVAEADGFRGLRLDGAGIRRAAVDGVSGGRANRDIHGMGYLGRATSGQGIVCAAATDDQNENLCGNGSLTKAEACAT